MRLSIALTIARKELTEILRDRRTLVLMIGLPVVLYPLLMIGLSRLQESQQAATQARTSRVAVWGTIPEALHAALEHEDAIEVLAWDGAPDSVRTRLSDATISTPVGDDISRPVAEAARAVLDRKDVDAVLVLWPGFGTSLGGNDLARAAIYYDSVRDDSTTAQRRVREMLDALRTDIVQAREATHDLPPGFAQGLDFERRDVARPARLAGRILGSFLPFLLISLSLFGGFYPAVDLTAGEKERGTMQTLLCAPLRPTEIVVGKFIAVWAICLTSAFANVASLALTMARLLPSTNLQVPTSAYLFTALMLLPITLTTTAIFIAVAVFARDFKDGQNFLTPVYMLLVMPAAATMLPGVELNPWTSFVPVVNIALLVKALLLGDVRADLVFSALVAAGMYATLSVLLAVRVFQREQILLGGKDTARGLFGLDERAGRDRPSPSLALSVFAVSLVLAFYASLFLETRGIVAMLLTVQLAFFLLPVVGVSRGLGFSFRETFALRAPSMMAVLGAVLVGATAWAGVTGLIVRLAPPPDSLVKAMERLVRLDDAPLSLWTTWAVIAVLPAICEELFFRGFVLSGLRSFGKWPAIGLSALLFAVSHASIYRLLPTLVLGLVLGYAVWSSRSILCGMIIHALNNGIIGTLTTVPELAGRLGVEQTTFGWPATLTGLAITLAGVGLLVMAARARSTSTLASYA